MEILNANNSLKEENYTVNKFIMIRKGKQNQNNFMKKENFVPRITAMIKYKRMLNTIKINLIF